MLLIPLVNSGPMVLQTCVWECYSHFLLRELQLLRLSFLYIPKRPKRAAMAAMLLNLVYKKECDWHYVNHILYAFK